MLEHFKAWVTGFLASGGVLLYFLHRLIKGYDDSFKEVNTKLELISKEIKALAANDVTREEFLQLQGALSAHQNTPH